MSLKEQLATLSPSLYARFGLARLAVFGSVARDDYTEASDVDLLAEFENPTPDTMPDRYFGLISEIEGELHRNVQLLTPGMLKNPFFKRAIERDLQDLPR